MLKTAAAFLLKAPAFPQLRYLSLPRLRPEHTPTTCEQSSQWAEQARPPCRLQAAAVGEPPACPLLWTAATAPTPPPNGRAKGAGGQGMGAEGACREARVRSRSAGLQAGCGGAPCATYGASPAPLQHLQGCPGSRVGRRGHEAAGSCQWRGRRRLRRGARRGCDSGRQLRQR